MRRIESTGNFDAIVDAFDMISISDESSPMDSMIGDILGKWSGLPMGELLYDLREALRSE